VKGRLLRDEPMDAEYWVEHVRERVRFAEAASELLAVGRPGQLIELGPKPVLGGLVRRIGLRPGANVLHLAPRADSGGEALAEVVAQLFRRGADPVWSALYQPHERRSGHQLAPYVFCSAHRYWGRKPVTGLQPGADDPSAWDAAEWHGAEPQDGCDDAVWQAVVAAISQVGDYTPGQISVRSRLYEDLGFDSVMAMELKDRIEAQLTGVERLSARDLLPVMSTAGDLADYLRGRRARSRTAP
jgi:acyl transferase domain-containing protein